MKLLGVGAAVIDLSVIVPRFPVPDEKLKAQKTMVAAGGNCLNSCICLKRLGAEFVELVTKIGDDSMSASLLSECTFEGIETPHVVKAPGASTPVSIILVDEKAKTYFSKQMLIYI